MMSRILLLGGFEALTLFQSILPRLHRDRFATSVMAGDRGRRAHRFLQGAVITTAVIGGLTIALTPDEQLYSWPLPMLMLCPQLVGLAFVAWRWRAVQSMPIERPNRAAALDLGHEKMPKAAWLAAFPPVIMLAFLFWLAAGWNPLLVRDTLGYVPGTTAWRDPAFRSVASVLFVGVGWSVWCGLFGLTMWHGVSRQCAWRRAQLEGAVATGWCFSLLCPAVVLPLWLRLPTLGLVLCAVAAASGVSILLIFAPRARRAWDAAEVQPPAYRLYFDWHDPSALGDRGMNLGSPWNWALFGAPAVFLALPLLLAFW